jgi:hypothetical protein
MSDLQSLLSSFSTSFYQDDFISQSHLYSNISALSSQKLSESSIQNQEFLKFQEDSNYFDQVLSHLRSPGWQMVSTSNEIIVESLSSGLDFYTKASVLIHSDMISTLSVLHEPDLLHTW